MPGFDQTGPAGRGPMTGRGLGPCGRGLRRGLGFRRMSFSADEEKAALEEEKQAIEQRLKELS